VLLDDAPQSVNRINILGQWHAAAKRYAIERRLMPLPVWARRGFEQDGAAAWRRLRDDLSAARSGSAVSVYIHVPFCDHRCGFCDCYSLPLGFRNRHKETEFEHALLGEIDAWAGIEALAKRPVTTVHFGGGTPNCLSAEVLNRIIERIRTRFGGAARAEWALESRTSLLADEHLEHLWRWGFRRLHVGVQTLEDEARKSIGRRESGDTAVRKVARSLELGFVVSVDILFGVPRQTLTGLVATLDRLVALGVHGFSLYGLHLSKRNSRFLERLIDPAGDPLRDYALFQTASQCLARSGYRRNHFTHWARAKDHNLYYTHPQRGEDLLGLGPTADGVFGFYHYRHPELEEYLQSAATAFPGLEGGVAETPLERRMRPAVTQLMGGRISRALVESLNAASLLEKWQECGFLETDSRGEQFSLTANGVWFLSSMLDELSETARSHLWVE
jgi:oxygen-independent coproporphyrinogen-3 oxidase